jgi:hypothetical protein
MIRNEELILLQVKGEPYKMPIRTQYSKLFSTLNQLVTQGLVAAKSIQCKRA